MKRALLVYDGGCGFCVRWARRWMRWDRARRLEIVAFQAPGVLERAGIGLSAAREAVWLVEEGRCYRGAAAVFRTLDLALGVPVFYAVYRLPGLGRVADGVYGWVAAHRHRFGGAGCGSHGLP
ncbi:thiol-disulfide oxidoreductase DCC family protein [Marinithermus hydrothermalis]|uniref:Thiol-disulfide oxidoreductase DCC n=1 Tax=Marinithermus hydrothermalis (strain DSM 14884 / JCM 11576 / T1) TaxID=869210 RepID=F2NLB9_MARHT|nr:DUF393 domain-containing protein [Marinithermus hydrothermalis]AEB11738.1 thiol-disulfide oxidoreductase DCC [Marinithermus hydrothermalis DSM 14884]